MKKKFKVLALFFLLSLFFFPVKGFSFQKINQIVAVVGEEFLTLYELEEMCTPFYLKLIPPEVLPTQKEAMKEEIRKRVLKNWIEETLLALEAKKYGFFVTDEEIESYLKEEIKALGGEEKLEKMLKEKGLTKEEYRNLIKDNLLKIKLVQFQVKEKVVVTEEEMRKLYQEIVKNYDRASKYWLDIFIVKESEEIANQIYSKVLNSKDWEEVYKEVQRMFEKKVVDFLKDAFKETELNKEILEKLVNLNPGEVIPPLKIGNFYYLIKLEKKGIDEPPFYEELKPRLQQKIFEEKAQKFLEKWIKELEEKKYIRIYLSSF